MNVKILVAALIAQIKHIATIWSPLMLANASQRIVSNGLNTGKSPRGPTQTFKTPSKGAMKLMLDPSGLMRPWVRSGLPKYVALETSSKSESKSA
jgi:hypothetical protein